MHSGGKVSFKREHSHPSEAHRKEHKLQKARCKAGKGRINAKSKDIKASDETSLVGVLQGKKAWRKGSHNA